MTIQERPLPISSSVFTERELSETAKLQERDTVLEYVLLDTVFDTESSMKTFDISFDITFS